MDEKTKAPKTSSKSEKGKTKPAPKKADKKSTEPKGIKKVFASIKRFFKDLRSETKKIVWNSKQDTIKNTGVVLLVTAVVGAGVWIADLLFGQLREFIFSLAADGGQSAMIMLQSLIDLL